ncbi:MAG: O-antigen ligase domain-containing protein [Sphingomonadaceae bacterium]|nr:MAG: O-antigen ligase domain-containing protein [Sphingomonadaceae bacterium]
MRARAIHVARPVLSPVMRYAAAGGIFFLVLFNVALISLDVASIPIRSGLALGLLAMLGFLRPEHFLDTIRRHWLVLALAGLLALLGTLVSLVNGADPAIVGRMLMEVHLQITVTLLLAAMLADLAGPRAAVLAICAAFAISAVVAAIQFIGLDAGWNLREILGRLQGHKLHEDSSFLNRRPMGLSYSPIHLATQACLGFAAYGAWRLRLGGNGGGAAGQIDPVIIISLAVMATVAFFTATRSPILGGAVFLAVYALRNGSAVTILSAAVLGVALVIAAPMILDAMQGAENRVFRVGDNSASGRLPLVTFGLMLFQDNPLGYGFDFISHEHWAPYWQELYRFEGAGEVREAELHNYLLNMLTTYGITLLIALPLVGRLLWRARHVAIVFVPYAVHALFHNTGPFWNDILFWFVVGAISAMRPALEGDRMASSPQRQVRPPRAFRPRRTA